jgi:hypothetical protein
MPELSTRDHLIEIGLDLKSDPDELKSVADQQVR